MHMYSSLKNNKSIHIISYIPLDQQWFDSTYPIDYQLSIISVLQVDFYFHI